MSKAHCLHDIDWGLLSSVANCTTSKIFRQFENILTSARYARWPLGGFLFHCCIGHGVTINKHSKAVGKRQQPQRREQEIPWNNLLGKSFKHECWVSSHFQKYCSKTKTWKYAVIFFWRKKTSLDHILMIIINIITMLIYAILFWDLIVCAFL